MLHRKIKFLTCTGKILIGKKESRGEEEGGRKNLFSIFFMLSEFMHTNFPSQIACTRAAFYLTEKLKNQSEVRERHAMMHLWEFFEHLST